MSLKWRILLEIILKLFFESKGIRDTTHILSGVKRCISNNDNAWLMKKYTDKEVVEALNSMGPTNASGDDGFSALFYQKCWHIVGGT